MFSLRELLKRPGAVGVFIILEMICFLLIIYANDRQGAIFFSFTDSVFGSVQEGSTNLVDKLAYKKRFDTLQLRYTDLLNVQENVLFDNRMQLDSMLEDSILERQYLSYPARVIANSFSLKNNYLTINKGSVHGIKRHMGVISNNGLVGIIVAVNKHYSRVLSLLHTRSMVTAEIKDKRLIGSLVWGRNNRPDIMYLEGIPKHHDINDGEIVETSSLSRVFPAGILIGTIQSHEEIPGSSTYRIEVKLNNDFRRLKDVYVVEHLHRDEIEELEAAFPDE